MVKTTEGHAEIGESKERDNRKRLDNRKDSYIKVALNALLCLCFFLPWIKLSSRLRYVLGMLDLGDIGNHLNMSPYRLLGLIKSLSRFSDSSASDVILVYGYVLIPILSIIGACTILFFKSKSKIINIGSSLVILMIALITYVKIASVKDVGFILGMSYGYFITIIASLANIGLNLGLVHGKFNPINVVETDSNREEKDTPSESQATKNFVEGKNDLVNFIKADFSKKDKAHRTLLFYGIIIIFALIVSMVNDIKDDHNILPGILAVSISVLTFYIAYFKLNFKINELQNSHIMALSDNLSNMTSYLKKLDEHLIVAIIGSIVGKFVVGYLILDYEMHAIISIVSLLLNFIIIALLVRAFALKNFKGLRYGSISLGIIYGFMIFRTTGHNNYWIDYDSLFMLGLAWIMYIFIESNYED